MYVILVCIFTSNLTATATARHQASSTQTALVFHAEFRQQSRPRQKRIDRENELQHSKHKQVVSHDRLDLIE